MDKAIDKILTQVKPKVQAILRTRRHYEARDLIGQFKTHIWSLLEMHNGCIFYASDTQLSRLDAIQPRFLRELDVAEDVAFLNFNFAPTQLKRNIGILGLLHKRVIGECHPMFSTLLPFCVEMGQPTLPGGHDKQLYGYLHEARCQLALFFRSIFAMVTVYNRLPQYVVNATTVHEFQKLLTRIARHQCVTGNVHWQHQFSRR